MKIKIIDGVTHTYCPVRFIYARYTIEEEKAINDAARKRNRQVKRGWHDGFNDGRHFARNVSPAGGHAELAVDLGTGNAAGTYFWTYHPAINDPIRPESAGNFDDPIMAMNAADKYLRDERKKLKTNPAAVPTPVKVSTDDAAVDVMFDEPVAEKKPPLTTKEQLARIVDDVGIHILSLTKIPTGRNRHLSKMARNRLDAWGGRKIILRAWETKQTEQRRAYFRCTTKAGEGEKEQLLFQIRRYTLGCLIEEVEAIQSIALFLLLNKGFTKMIDGSDAGLKTLCAPVIDECKAELEKQHIKGDVVFNKIHWDNDCEWQVQLKVVAKGHAIDGLELDMNLERAVQPDSGMGYFTSRYIRQNAYELREQDPQTTLLAA